jgi:hypothetical protein
LILHTFGAILIYDLSRLVVAVHQAGDEPIDEDLDFTRVRFRHLKAFFQGDRAPALKLALPSGRYTPFTRLFHVAS